MQGPIVNVLTASAPAPAAWRDVTPPVLPLADVEVDSFFSIFSGVKGLVLAVSGGPDSMAMMHLAAAWKARTKPDFTMVVASVNHGFRAEAAAEVEAVAKAAARLRLIHHALALDPDNLRGGTQEAAREARYDSLIALAHQLGASHIATGHMLDDQAETILMRLAAGSGLTGLTGMRALVKRNGIIIARPFLDVAKVRLLVTCEALGVAYARDPSNEDARYARARWRSLMPALASEGLTPERLANFARRMERIDETLNHEAFSLYERAIKGQDGDSDTLDASLFLQRGHDIVLRTLALAVERLRRRGGRKQVRPQLARAEALTETIMAALHAGESVRRTLCGAVVSLDGRGRLTLKLEGPRKRGFSKPFDVVDQPATSLSLGKPPDRS